MPEAIEVKSKVGVFPVVLKQTQRYKYRASKTVCFEDLEHPSRSFSAACDLFVALDSSKNIRYTAEDVAIEFDGRESELMELLTKAMGIDPDQIEETPEENSEKKD